MPHHLGRKTRSFSPPRKNPRGIAFVRAGLSRSASFDGRSILRPQDCEGSVRAFVAEQSRVRDFLRPNAGVTNDAQCANALIGWLERNAPGLKIVKERDVRQGLRKTLARLGPGCLEYTTKNLMRQGVIWYGEIPEAKPYAGRLPHGYQLLETGTLG
jgi:hypothetical protein